MDTLRDVVNGGGTESKSVSRKLVVRGMMPLSLSSSISKLGGEAHYSPQVDLGVNSS